MKSIVPATLKGSVETMLPSLRSDAPELKSGLTVLWLPWKRTGVAASSIKNAEKLPAPSPTPVPTTPPSPVACPEKEKLALFKDTPPLVEKLPTGGSGPAPDACANTEPCG